MISAMAVRSFMTIPSPGPADMSVGLLPIVGTGFCRSLKGGVRLAREVLICVGCLTRPPRLLDSITAVSGILGRPVKSRATTTETMERLETVIASEAKQSTARTMVTMDCFVASLLAMTSKYDSAISRREAPEVLQKPFAPLITEGEGKPGGQCTRSLACEI